MEFDSIFWKRQDCEPVKCNCKADEQCVMQPPTQTECAKTSCIKSSNSQSGTETSSTSESNTGAIAGGVVGGVVGAILLAGICIWFFYLRRNKQLQINNEEDEFAQAAGSESERQYMDRVSEEEKSMSRNPSQGQQPNGASRFRDSTATMSTVNTVGGLGSNVIPIAYIPGVSGVNNNNNTGRLPPGLKFTASDILRDDSIRASIATTNYRASTAFIGSDTVTAIQARPNLVQVNDQQRQSGYASSPVTATFMKPSLLDLDAPDRSSNADAASPVSESSSAPQIRSLTRPPPNAGGNGSDRIITPLNTIEEVPTPSSNDTSSTQSSSGFQQTAKSTQNKFSSSANHQLQAQSSAPRLRVSVASDFDVAFPSEDMLKESLSPANSTDAAASIKQVGQLANAPNIPVPIVPGAGAGVSMPTDSLKSGTDSSSIHSSSKCSSKSSFRLSRQALRNSALSNSINAGSPSNRSSRARDSDLYVAEDLPMEAFLYAQSHEFSANAQEDGELGTGRSSPFDDRYEMIEKQSK